MNKRFNSALFVCRPWLGAACLFILILTGCGMFPSASPAPVDVVFDTPQEEIQGGVRLAPVESQWDGFGEAVDVYGDVLAVGASEWNQLGTGSVYIYRSSNGEWHEEAQLTASDRDESLEQAQLYGGQRFGTSVALGDGVIAVGAPGSVYSNPEYNGAVYIFEHHEDAWVETARLVPSGSVQAGEEDRLEWLDFNRMKPRVFGSHVALAGDTLAVGGDADGTIYIYESGENGWQEQARVEISDLEGKTLYIASMSLFGDTLALSAFYISPQEQSQDQLPFLSGNVIVYVFERMGNAWEESFQFSPEEEAELLFFREVNVGASVALGGESGQANLLAIGLPGFPDWTGELNPFLFGVPLEQVSPEPLPEFPVSNQQTGAVYLFERSGGDWQKQATLKPSGWDDPPGPGSFSSIMPSHLEELSDDEKADFFSSHIFPGHLYSEIPEISFFGATVDMDRNRLAVTSGYANSTYIFEREVGEWKYRARLKPKNEKIELWEDFTQPVKINGHTLVLGTPSEFGNSAYVFDLCIPLAFDCR